jgi:glutathione S-transferase
MVQLADNDILTREVLKWDGVHLFHYFLSSCSQKVRICLNLKGIEWQPHPIDLFASENFSQWFLGINPRGLVPVLVIDGQVHIESNDILVLLDERFPEPTLIPDRLKADISRLLDHEDELHLDLRTITFRFTQPPGKAPKSRDDLERYRAGGSGTVLGVVDGQRPRELEFWERAAAPQGISDNAVRVSARKFRLALDELDGRLASEPYLLGDDLTVLDIAWFIYVNRLKWCGYPVERLHVRVNDWFEKLSSRPEFAKEIEIPGELQAAVAENLRHQRVRHAALEDIARL